MDGVRAVLDFEDKFAMLVDNLVEFEFGLLRISTAHLVGRHQTHDDFLDRKRELNRYLTNLLSTARQYVDQNHKHIEPLLQGTGVSFTKCTNEAYEASLAYRTMESLRNDVQHRDLGVHILYVEGAWIDIEDDEKKKRRHRTTALLDLEELALDRDLKGKGVIQELKDQPFQPDIPFLLREYVGRLADITNQFAKR